ncbi:MAG TPA: RNase adapter RapZ [Chitinophagaceae bacterium]|nr:phosphotransferase [Chitinophagaceae bacterium]HMZ45516.1 RNase adapter RapZ [Chitinophagaceae bacterium]HNF29677.1 RNase adapter RapZ [Chitinophagaceae bacterium]
MNIIVNNIESLFYNWQKSAPLKIEKLQQSGSDRIYFRVFGSHQNYIATYNLNIQENKSFIAFARHFKNKGLNVPEIYCHNEDYTIYIQQDVGEKSLLNLLEEYGQNDFVFNFFKESLKQLAAFQIIGNEGMDYSLCLTAQEFGKEAILSDLLYFKYYFLDTLKLPYDKQAMLKDFDALSTYLSYSEHKYFMFRDFQSRNIMLENNKISFIDFQGGMKGALQYDVASLLWQAKAALSNEWKDALLEYYMDEAEKLLHQKIERNSFISQYHGYVLIRLLQVLGAYGFRGLFERKAHFLTSIPLGLLNLKYFIENKKVGITTPEFDRVLKIIISNNIFEKFTPQQANDETRLLVTINSFSYKNGIPADTSENGGGFVFDMRGILNPGRQEVYKYLSGKDKPVQDFLDQQTKMPNFLNSVWDLIDINVENYLTRDFENLMINFGCTGGQHRSVYAAEQTARHLRNKYKLKVILNHTNQANWLRK